MNILLTIICLIIVAGIVAVVAKSTFLMNNAPSRFVPKDPLDKWESEMCNALNRNDKEAIRAGVDSHQEKNENSGSFH